MFTLMTMTTTISIGSFPSPTPTGTNSIGVVIPAIATMEGIAPIEASVEGTAVAITGMVQVPTVLQLSVISRCLTIL
jgi:hypothetical protein